MATSNPILIIGAGSIGERHIRNLWALGYENIIVYRQRNLPFRDIGAAKVTVVLTWDDVIKANPFAAIICTPTAQHLQQTVDCLQAGMHVLVEKPIAHELCVPEEFIQDHLKETTMLQVGYMLRYHPLLQQVKTIIEEKTYGNLLNIQTYWGEYLPDWHPWEDYTQSYAAKDNEGGGAALTLSHDIDVALWWGGKPIGNSFCTKTQPSKLNVNTNSCFNLLLQFKNNATAHVHTNFCQKVPQRLYKILLDDAVIDVDYFASAITIATVDGVTKKILENFDRNDLFISQLKDFFARIKAGDFYEFSKEQIINANNIIGYCYNY